MAGWFAALMQKGNARSPRAIAGAKRADAGRILSERDPRFDAIVQLLRDREPDDRAAREKRQRGYRQSLESDVGAATDAAAAPIRLHKFRTKVPCRMTPDGRALLHEIRTQFPRGTVTFPQVATGKQAVMLTPFAGAAPRQIGWVEHSAQTDPKLCNVRDQGLSVETDGGGTMLVLRFRYPPTAVTMSSSRLPRGASDDVATVDFTEIRPALDLRPPEKSSSPRLVWITRPEVETMNALQSRDYEAFYVRFKLEVQAGIWSALSALLASSPGSQWHQGSCYTVVREADAADRRIRQRTVDDSGNVVDIGADRIYDAAPATDILLLYLDGDILADFADIYFTLQSLGSADAYFLKEEFFSVVRRFWASSDSLVSRYSSDLAAVVRISQRVLPMPTQAPLLKQDWTNLRQALVDRYGERGRKAAVLAGEDHARPRVRHSAWPFESFPAGEVNVGLRVVYRQEWRDLGLHRGEVVRNDPPAQREVPRESGATALDTPTRDGAEGVRTVETIIEPGSATMKLDEIVDLAASATVEAMKWPLDFEGCISTGIRDLAATTDMGLEAECRESSRETSARLSDIMRKTVERIHDETAVADDVEPDEDPESSSSTDVERVVEEDQATRVYSRLQNRYEVLTRPAEIQNVVLVAEKLPTPADIDLAWVRHHDWILAKVLLDESFRDALNTIGQEARTPQRGLELDAKRDSLYEHIRANILHYQRAIWQREDPQQRSMRYRKSGKRVPLEWRFELESGGALMIDDLCDRLAAPDVAGQFASYTPGHDADLDQLIDPAGPIGYYGNYAIYHMRPEFGSADLFAMLHFFKSPYLRANPETGEPEVDDPAQIQISEDPAVVAAGDRVIAEHRDEMFQYVPELRMELAAARAKVRDGSDPNAVKLLEQQAALLRRHFATYLFRRERARRIALDTDGVVIDVIRSVAPEPEAIEEPEHRADAAVLSEAHAGLQLLLESGPEMKLLGANGHQDAEPDWVILGSGEARTRKLLAGAGGETAQANDAEPRLLISARSDGEHALDLLVGRPRDPDAERVIVAREDGGLRLISGSGRGGFEAEQQGIRSGNDEERSSKLVAGLGPPNADERTIVAGHETRVRLAPSSGVAAPDSEELVILAGSEGARTPMLLAGAGGPDAHEQLILAREDGRLRLTPGAGAGVNHAHERLILAGENEWLRPTLIAR